jgi:hypothetical protein
MIINFRKIKKMWESKYNLFKFQNLKDILSVFISSCVIILWLVTFGPSKLTPNIELEIYKTEIAVRPKKWIDSYKNYGQAGFNSLLEALKKSGFIYVEKWSQFNGYLIYDPDVNIDKINENIKNSCINWSKEEYELYIAKERLGYVPSGERELKKEDVLGSYLLCKYNILAYLDSFLTRNVHIKKDMHEVIEKIKDKQFLKFAYVNLASARKVITVFKIRNKGNIKATNIKITINLLKYKYDEPYLLETLSQDGIGLIVDNESYKELNIPILEKGKDKIFIIRTNSEVVSKDDITYSYDTIEKVNWAMFEKSLIFVLFVILFLFFMDKKFCKGDNL